MKVSVGSSSARVGDRTERRRRARVGRWSEGGSTRKPTLRWPARAPFHNRVSYGPGTTSPMSVAGTSWRRKICEELREVLRSHIQDHPFLGLGDPDLPRAETLLAQRHKGKVNARAETARVHELAGRRGEATAPEVLLAADQPVVVRFEAGVDQRFLHDRVAELDRAPGFGFAAVGELLRGEGDVLDPVAAGEPTDQHEAVPGRASSVRRQSSSW